MFIPKKLLFSKKSKIIMGVVNFNKVAKYKKTTNFNFLRGAILFHLK